VNEYVAAPVAAVVTTAEAAPLKVTVAEFAPAPVMVPDIVQVACTPIVIQFIV
jgi:hypothetical protein